MEKLIDKEIRQWYESIDGPFLDGAITKYSAESSVISQLFVHMKDKNWSILDIMVSSENHQLSNGYVQCTQFEPQTEATEDDPMEVISRYWCE